MNITQIIFFSNVSIYKLKPHFFFTLNKPKSDEEKNLHVENTEQQQNITLNFSKFYRLPMMAFLAIF